jgi:hypothetical protein
MVTGHLDLVLDMFCFEESTDWGVEFRGETFSFQAKIDKVKQRTETIQPMRLHYFIVGRESCGWDKRKAFRFGGLCLSRCHLIGVGTFGSGFPTNSGSGAVILIGPFTDGAFNFATASATSFSECESQACGLPSCQSARWEPVPQTTHLTFFSSGISSPSENSWNKF